MQMMHTGLQQEMISLHEKMLVELNDGLLPELHLFRE